MKNLLLVLTAYFFFLPLVKAQNVKKDPVQHFFIGTYTNNGSKGIYRGGLNTATGQLLEPQLLIDSNDPSFLALTKDQKFLLAVNEVTDKNGNKSGYIESFSVSPDGSKLERVSKVLSGGAHPAYVSVNDGFALAANYTGGSVALFNMDKDGKLQLADVKQHYGKGPVKDRQESPHVHSAFFEPGTDRIFVADLGTDKIAVYQLDKSKPQLIPAKVPEIQLTPGSGPRHLAFHPKKKIVYTANELSSSVSVISLNKDGSFTELQTISALPKDFTQSNTCADIHISHDGRYLYVSNRGLNSIAVFSTDPQTGKIQLIAEEPTRGQNPRNFTLSSDDRYLLAANQTTSNIAAFKRDSKTGLLTFTSEIKAFTPVCLVFQK
jgi:6-phosphogluconolactonase